MKKETTMGVLLVNGKRMCYTMEPPVNPNIKHPKGAIAMGYYKVTLTVSPRFKRMLPLLNMVPGFEGVRIHAGNRVEDTKGCILVGQDREKKNGKMWLKDARRAEQTLVEYILHNTAKNEEIFLDITDREHFYVERMQYADQYL